MERETAIAISTRDRPWYLDQAKQQWMRWYPDATVIVIEDNSEVPRGIAATKNLCLQALADSGCEHGFLADDDVFPLDDVGLHKYINSGYNHMCMSFDHLANGRRISADVYVKNQLPNCCVFNSPCGCLLYANRSVLDSGIRFDENYGIWGMEHKDYSMQIHNAGLTPYPFIDIIDSLAHFYSHDYHMTIKSSVSEDVRIEEIKRNQIYYNEKFGG